MENCKNNNQHTLQNQHATSVAANAGSGAAELRRNAHFEYAPPTLNELDISFDDAGSNKSTPYYTPLEFFQGSFEFPSPKLEKVSQSQEDIAELHAQMHNEPVMESAGQIQPGSRKIPTPMHTPTLTPTAKSIAATVANAKQLTGSTTSPVVNRKLRRFSLYERRSCSPQQLLIKNASSMEGTADCERVFAADKENAKPPYADKRDEGTGIHNLRSNSGNSSPIALIDETGSPKILVGSDIGVVGNRLPCSPKLLASLNNLNLTGSPLGVISSAGYKNGNYFKFPEIDHVVQENSNVIGGDAAHLDDTTAYCDNQANRNRQRNNAITKSINGGQKCNTCSGKVDNARPSAVADECEPIAGRIFQSEVAKSSAISTSKADCKKNRKNKNNLTIKITDVPYATQHAAATAAAVSPSKPKTPTIKSTKEKALSLDSAARESELTIFVSSGHDAHASCDEIDAQMLRRSCGPAQFMQRNAVGAPRYERVAPCERIMRYPSAAASNRSTSMSQLALLNDPGHMQTLCSNTLTSLKTPLSGSGFPRTPRRRLTGGSSSSNNASTEWLSYHRKQNLADAFGGDPELFEHPSMDVDTVVVLQEADEAQAEGTGLLCPPLIQSSCSSSSATPSSLAVTPHRGMYKHNAMLHASNTNLKTLPELLTLVEFSTTTPGSKENNEFPHKQKSIDLPSTSGHAKNITSSTSTNLLQRRGSNHSLTLNLHGSCSNLLGNCRSGLSVSNYSLGSVANSTSNLNSKSSCNLDLNSAHGNQPLNPIHPNIANTQGVKQSLFRRRGSNHSLTLTNLTAASCGNLNSFASQNSLNVERAQPSHFKVTRTTSFITPTHNTASNVTPKRGLLERRGSNQSLTLNMGGSFGGIGTERHVLANSSLHIGETCVEEADAGLQSKLALPTCCAPQTPHRRFFSSESLNRGNTQFADLNQAHKRNAKQVCFGSVSDLKPSASTSMEGLQQGSMSEMRRDSFNFQDSTVCTCTGVRNIMTRPLSPQSTSEEFKIYLANIQMLQNASNALNQIDLIKLNHIFDNSYASNKGLAEQAVPMLSVRINKEAETPPGTRVTTSEDCEVAERYMAVVKDVLVMVVPDDDEQKRIFCDLHKEFWDLPPNHQEKPMVFGSQAKNRYKTILPNENSRVLLERESKQLAELAEDIKEEHAQLAESLTRQLSISDEVSYINANYIKGPDYTSKCYVATQGPLPNTIFEFWLMVHQNTRRYFQTTDTKAGSPQYYQKIIMLTDFLENNRQKCAVYFPVELNEIFITTNKQDIVSATPEVTEFFNAYLQPNEATPHPLRTSEPNEQSHIGIEYYNADVSAELQRLLPPSQANYFVIKNIGIVRKNGYSIRKLIVLYCVNIIQDDSDIQLLIHRFYCYHYWYPDWPDHRSPRDINTLLDICLHILNLGKCEAEFEAYCEHDLAPESPPLNHIEAHAVELYQQDIFNTLQPLPIIHCSAGIGRTGCLTAILNAIRQLRQSFAYSLTSMAAEVSKVREGGDIAAVLSPVDFSLPSSFVQEARNGISTLNSDTDSSFTRNTLFYINYILRRRKHDDAETCATAPAGESWPLLTVTELPKMPDVFVDVLGIVCNLRLQRGGMVQNSEQYELIHRAICLYLKRTFALKRF